MSLLNGEGSGSNSSGILDANGNPLRLWNYTSATDKQGNPRDDYAQSITGVVTQLAEVQSTKYQSSELEWWDKEKTKPKMDIEIAIQTPDKGELVWHIKPGSLKKYEKFSLARKAIIDALRTYFNDPSTMDMTKLVGLQVTVSTKDMITQDGQVIGYGAANPRPWEFKILGQGDLTAQPTVINADPAPVQAAKAAQAAAEAAEVPANPAQAVAEQAAKVQQAQQTEGDDIPF